MMVNKILIVWKKLSCVASYTFSVYRPGCLHLYLNTTLANTILQVYGCLAVSQNTGLYQLSVSSLLQNAVLLHYKCTSVDFSSHIVIASHV